MFSTKMDFYRHLWVIALSPCLHSWPLSSPVKSTMYVLCRNVACSSFCMNHYKNSRKNINKLNIQRSLGLGSSKTAISCTTWRNCRYLCSFHITTFFLLFHYVKPVYKMEFLPYGFQTLSFSTEAEHLPFTHTFLIRSPTAGWL